MAKTAAEKTADYRRRMREKGYRQITLWVPDLRNPKVVEEIRREVRALKKHPSDAEGTAFAEAALAEIEGWEP